MVEIVEDINDYRGFEAIIIADYDARTAVERELVLRLASLLGRTTAYQHARTPQADTWRK